MTETAVKTTRQKLFVKRFFDNADEVLKDYLFSEKMERHWGLPRDLGTTPEDPKEEIK